MHQIKTIKNRMCMAIRYKRHLLMLFSPIQWRRRPSHIQCGTFSMEHSWPHAHINAIAVKHVKIKHYVHL